MPDNNKKPQPGTNTQMFHAMNEDCVEMLNRHHAEEVKAAQAQKRRRAQSVQKPVDPQRAADRPANPQRPVQRKPRPADAAQRSVRRAEDAQRPVQRRTDTAGTAARPRRKKKQPKYKRYQRVFNLINIAACLLLLFGIGLRLLIGKRASGFLQSENRNLAEFPSFSLSSYFSGDYTSDITYYYTDTISNREGLRNLANKFTDHFGLHKDDVEIIGSPVQADKGAVESSKPDGGNTVTVYTGGRDDTTTTVAVTTVSDSAAVSGSAVSSDAAVTETSTQPAETEPVQTKKRTEIPDEGEVVNQAVIVSGKGTPEVRAMPMFGGIYDIGKQYAGVLNDYKTMVGDKVNVYNMSVPLSSAFYCPKNLAANFSDQHDCIINIANSLDKVINIDVFPTLQEHSDEYIFFRTDHHWEPLGAYYAAQEFCKAASVTFVELKDMEECIKENFTGSMYGYSGYLEDLKTWPDTFYYYKPKNEYTIQYYDETFTTPDTSREQTLFYSWADGVNTYSTILGGDLDIAEIKTDVHNGRTLVVIKNSYGNALIPFFVGSFEKVYVIDFRYVEITMQDFFQRVGATDVLFGMAMSSCYTPGHIDAIREIMQ
ncbi:MAG: DHHW family protein [Oscillospiraceae bacterium]|nr:DHHW family protein [Oscillospiraceae bacterium]